MKDAYDIFVMNADGTGVRRISASQFSDRSPSWSPDGKNIVFISDRNGINNLYSVNLEQMTVMALTNLLTGASSPCWSPDGNNIAFTCFKDGGWDIHVLKRPLSRDLKMESISPTLYRSQSLKISAADSLKPEVILRDTGSGQQLAAERVDGKPYGLKFSPDMVNAFASYNTFYGVGGMGQVSFSDILGNHRINVGARLVYSLEESDLALSYIFLKKRTNYGISLFHYKTYYYSSDWSIFGDRILGGSLVASRPFSRFERLDLSLNLVRLERDMYQTFGYDPYYGYPYTSEKIHLDGIKSGSIGVDLVHDNALWENTGPVNGSRSQLSVQYSPPTALSDLSYTTVSADYRKYHRFLNRYNFFTRFSGGASFGRDPRMFFMGGDEGWLNARVKWIDPGVEQSKDIYFAQTVFPLRGYRWDNFFGPYYFLNNFEFRFPFIDYLVLGWPLQFGIGNIGGVLFADVGSAWGKYKWKTVPMLNEDGSAVTDTDGNVVYEQRTVLDKSFHGGGQGANGNFRLDDIKMSVGFGMRMNLGFVVLRLDAAWPTNLDTTDKPMYTISIGPDY